MEGDGYLKGGKGGETRPQGGERKCGDTPGAEEWQRDKCTI